MFGLSSTERFVSAIARAREVTLVAYLLPHGDVASALASAARRGAHVVVRLEGRPYYDARGGVHRLNASIVADLRRAGADARLVDDDGAGPQLHAKAALVDGALYLDDVNFGANGTILRDAPPRDGVAFRKPDALAMEAALLARARRGDDVVVESESIGSGNAVYSCLERLGRAGMRPRVLVSREAESAKEHRLLGCLERNGVRVRICSSNEKFALAGTGAWVGSANATSAFCTPQQVDWGARTRSRAVVAHLRERFEARWQTAREISA